MVKLDQKFSLLDRFFLEALIHLLIQNIYINQSALSSDIYRFLFYFVLYAFITNSKEELKDLNFPMILFIFLSTFSIISYLLEINLGVDDYQTWSIGFNPSELDYLKGRTNGFQAGGPNSFADLIVIVTYSRFSLIVLISFILLKLIKEKLYIQLLGSVLILLISANSLGVYERFLNDDNNGISDRLLMLQASTEYYSESSIESKLFGNGSNQLIFQSENVYLYDEFDNNPYSYGPHNSFIFYLINYGALLFILIFTSLLKRGFNFNPNFITVIVFLVLSMATDLLHNHSVAWLLYFAYFSYIKTEN